MSASATNSSSNGCENPTITREQQQKISEVRHLIGHVSEKLSLHCSDAAILRYLRARNWHVKKAAKMLKATLKWRLEYKPEEIRWDEIAREAETGKIYRSNYMDKFGRTVLVMRPGCQNSKSTKGQIRYLVYCMENAILNLPRDQEQMVWLIDFKGFNMSHISVKVTRETAHVLQEYYPERLGIAILYDPPKFFEPFWTVVKPFLEPKTANKVKFVYPNDPNTNKIMDELFDNEVLESSFGGKDNEGFGINKYAERMREDDKRMSSSSSSLSNHHSEPAVATPSSFDAMNLESDSDASDEKSEKLSVQGVDVEESPLHDDSRVTDSRSEDDPSLKEPTTDPSVK